jgi:hypothetical protein
MEVNDLLNQIEDFCSLNDHDLEAFYNRNCSQIDVDFDTFKRIMQENLQCVLESPNE